MASRVPKRRSLKKNPVRKAAVRKTFRQAPAPRSVKTIEVPTLSPVPRQAEREKRWKRIAAVLATLLFFSPLTFTFFGDSIHFERIMSKEDKFFQGFLDLVQKGEGERVVGLMSPELREDTRKKLGEFLPVFEKAGELQACHLLNFTWKSGSRELTYYLDYETGSGIVRFRIHPEGDSFLVDDFHLQAIDRPYHQIYQFPSLLDVSIVSLLALVFAVLLNLWNARVLVECCFTPLKRKWLWILFILMGFMTLTLYLNPTGSFQLEFLTFKLPVAGISKDPLLEPWKVEMSFPLGALVFLWRKNYLKKTGV